MPVTLIVEPDKGGHRFQAVAFVAALAGRRDTVVLLTSKGSLASEEFAAYLGDVKITVDECFDERFPPTRDMARAIARYSRTAEVTQSLVMDADQSLKRWFYVARQEFRGLRPRPRVTFMLTRYPTSIALTDHVGWKMRVTKSVCLLLARATGTMHRAAGFASRDDLSPGWLVKRARDPAICSAHSRDRAPIRADLGLPADRQIVGIFGWINERKYPPLALEAIVHSGTGADLLLAGDLDPTMQAWVDALPADLRVRVRVDRGFLSNDLLDRYVAAADIALIAINNNGPSGIMGKALAAGVPVITAGSRVRAREIAVTRAGLAAELTAASIGDGIATLLAGRGPAVRADAIPAATADAFARVLLGLSAHDDAARVQHGAR